MELQGKAAIVTGSTSGIGLAIATRFAREGAKVMLNGLGDKDAIEKTRRELAAEHGVEIRYSPADMSKSGEIHAMVGEAEKAFGAVDILVNNAGIQYVAPIDSFPDEKWEQIIAINLSAAFYATKAAVPGMKKRRWGRIINIASSHGLVASAQKAAYVAAKHGIIGLTKVTALDYANDGITANAICPGWVLTPLVQKQIEARAAAEKIPVAKASEDLLREKQPMLRFTVPEDLAALALFLASDAAKT